MSTCRVTQNQALRASTGKSISQTPNKLTSNSQFEYDAEGSDTSLVMIHSRGLWHKVWTNVWYQWAYFTAKDDAINEDECVICAAAEPHLEIVPHPHLSKECINCTESKKQDRQMSYPFWCLMLMRQKGWNVNKGKCKKKMELTNLLLMNALTEQGQEMWEYLKGLRQNVGGKLYSIK